MHWQQKSGLPVGGAGATAAGLGLLMALALFVSACAPLTQAQAGPYFPVIRTPTGTMTPTPGPLRYTVGIWPSNSAPLAGSIVTIYVSFRDSGVPVPDALVSATLAFPTRTRAGPRYVGAGPRPTNPQGYAALAVNAGPPVLTTGKSQQTVQVNVTVTYQGNTYHASTNFTPIP